MLTSLLIANRGEIACRIIRTARRLGLRTVAVYSDADTNALHVRSADEAVHIGPSPARESYLVGEKIIAAARATGAEAIHPGYGFLSENADFAQAVLDAGLVWVGPRPDSIRAMGLKDAAKARMIAAGVPVTPGYLGEDQSPTRLQSEADAIGYPILIKAVAGGGGKGMRRVDAPEDFVDALASCQREAASSFGDDRVLLEKYILSPRHIEVQVFGDTHGNIVHLFERDCSLQRRHQKVIEEAPAPGMDPATREAICAAAVRAARAVDYVGAGTIEFIADASSGLSADRIWFMEMNTRLQVEHPVTEEITGVDLVEWQLRVASGEPLPKRQEELSINGHAIEARLYAEDPAKGFLPSTGRLAVFDLDRFRSSARIDTGVERGGEISPFYDPMIAKIIGHAADRTEAAEDVVGELLNCAIWPVQTNAGFLVGLLREEAFLEGRVDTGLIERNIETLTAEPEPAAGILNAAMRVLDRASDNQTFTACDLVDRGGSTAWSIDNGFRLNGPSVLTARLIDQHGNIHTFELGNGVDPAFVQRQDGWAIVPELGFTFAFKPYAIYGSATASAGNGTILAPMPGRIIAVDVAAGDAVTRGQKLLTLEAMKMEHSLTAPFDGTVAELNAVAGAQVQVEALLARIEPKPEE
ncbi:acetyl/propionyl/methylcrotonyl-CoA carboxylase subunit alpha [Sphingobium nicotianae]|uniref:Acetyl/propionyl/methylcrotonyl-CoA carboxylase subunit alpha n=1 Tax=Sphingobium nicotianae TaxID=2782607 RepID=A0A9X1IS83_9SPHN|nr:acetyl/propionyl/methylcrotonyl-CoA carboxylase subunit alpha [Sphingobium nicotianae]MBT2188173.1 acetyl/propionyl/methylcrotonyl-CoA carboxylase subunit alpha [Sphingobium nicotianae]